MPSTTESTIKPLPRAALSAAITLTDSRVTVAALARTCGVTTSAVGLWLRHDGVVTDPAMISAIQIAFREAGVVLEHEPDNFDNDTFGVSLPGGWMVGTVGET